MADLTISPENGTISYGDFIIQPTVDSQGKKTLKIMTDVGFMQIKPQTGNSIIVETTKNKET